MRRFALRHVMLWLAFLALAGCASLNQNFAPVAAVMPQAGARWTYQVVNGYNRLPVGRSTWEVVSATPDRFQARVTEEPTAETSILFRESSVRVVDSSWNPDSGNYPPGLSTGGFWSGIPTGAPVRYDPPLPLFRFPLAPGQRWRESVTVTNPVTGMQVRVDVVARVQGMERIKVPAGEFDAIKVQRDLYYQDPERWRSGVKQRAADWYAPSLNLVVLHREDSYYFDYTRDRGEQRSDGDWVVLELLEPPARR